MFLCLRGLSAMKMVDDILGKTSSYLYHQNKRLLSDTYDSDSLPPTTKVVLFLQIVKFAFRLCVT